MPVLQTGIQIYCNLILERIHITGIATVLQVQQVLKCFAELQHQCQLGQASCEFLRKLDLYFLLFKMCIGHLTLVLKHQLKSADDKT